MRVSLLPTTISAKMIVPILQSARTEYERLMVQYPDVDQSDSRAKVSTIDNFIKSATGNISTFAAFSICKSTSPWGHFDGRFPVQTCTLKSVKTMVDGQYRLDGIPEGNYYLHAVWDTGQIRVEWIIPVKAQGQILQIDLSNDNAASIIG
jgi:hypothetical protein